MILALLAYAVEPFFESIEFKLHSSNEESMFPGIDEKLPITHYLNNFISSFKKLKHFLFSFSTKWDQESLL